jgi:hypothetical protein
LPAHAWSQTARTPFLDRARTFLTLVVLLHHAVIPYTHYGHTDPKEFFAFDMFVLATDSFEHGANYLMVRDVTTSEYSLSHHSAKCYG